MWGSRVGPLFGGALGSGVAQSIFDAGNSNLSTRQRVVRAGHAAEAGAIGAGLFSGGLCEGVTGVETLGGSTPVCYGVGLGVQAGTTWIVNWALN
jgi:hypothetical protein